MRIRRPSELGAIIAEARRKLGLTQAALAGQLGVSRVWLGQIERGKSSARIDMVFRVLNELSISLSAEQDMPPSSKRHDTRSPEIDIDAIANTGLEKQAEPARKRPKRS